MLDNKHKYESKNLLFQSANNTIKEASTECSNLIQNISDRGVKFEHNDSKKIPEEDSFLENFEEKDDIKHYDFSLSNVNMSMFSTNKKEVSKMIEIDSIDIDFEFKVILLGDFNIGKTSFMISLFNIYESKEPFIITSSSNHFISLIRNLDNITNVKLNIWDTAGEEKFSSVPKQFLRDSKGVFLLFDLTNKKSFYNINKWKSLVKATLGQEIPIVLLGTKSDLSNERQVSYSDASVFAKTNNMDYLEINNYNHKNIEPSLDYITRCMILSLESQISKDNSLEEKKGITKVTSFKNFKERVKHIKKQYDITAITKMKDNKSTSIVLDFNIENQRKKTFAKSRDEISNSCC